MLWRKRCWSRQVRRWPLHVICCIASVLGHCMLPRATARCRHPPPTRPCALFHRSCCSGRRGGPPQGATRLKGCGAAAAAGGAHGGAARGAGRRRRALRLLHVSCRCVWGGHTGDMHNGPPAVNWPRFAWLVHRRCLLHALHTTACREELGVGEEVQVMPCQGAHAFHLPCLAPWLADNNSCPVCRCALCGSLAACCWQAGMFA